MGHISVCVCPNSSNCVHCMCSALDINSHLIKLKKQTNLSSLKPFSSLGFLHLVLGSWLLKLATRSVVHALSQCSSTWNESKGSNRGILFYIDFIQSVSMLPISNSCTRDCWASDAPLPTQPWSKCFVCIYEVKQWDLLQLL
jgi:hypothetical protein